MRPGIEREALGSRRDSRVLLHDFPLTLVRLRLSESPSSMVRLDTEARLDYQGTWTKKSPMGVPAYFR